MESSSENISPKQSRKDFWKEIIKLVVLAVIIVIPFRLYIAKPFLVEGASMDPTFDTGDYLIVDELSYQFKAPERGSILVFKYPLDPRKHFIKRVIGLPGETIEVREGVITILNDEHPEGFVLDEPYVEIKKAEDFDFILEDGQYFVLGDNRMWSADSRVWGPLPEENIIGRPILRAWPAGIFPGQVRFPESEIEEVNNNNP